MKLSIVIVSYNVRSFLDLTLFSVYSSETDYDYEVFIVDNNSTDDSVKMVKEKYPDAILIENKDNPGFSIANNQAIVQAHGEYVLLLNPDTIIQENTVDRIVKFMDQHDEAGALGVPMLDGSGVFLPESKRGFPSPWVSFTKMTGLSSVFRSSRVFNSYHLGYLDERETHEIDILAGAFMLLRKSMLDQVGMLDEAFFMYGEDIDLSYRIQKAGFKNYYLADTKIIHFKGESTKKASFNYVKTFYNAMIIFGKKHFAKSQVSFLVFFLNIAIYFKAALSYMRGILNKTYAFFIDNIIIIGTGLIISELWEYFYFFEGYFNFRDNIYNLLLYSLVYTGMLYLNGSYDRKPRLSSFLKSMMYSSLVLISIYGLLNENLRFSRAVVFLLSISTFITLPLWRNMLSLIGGNTFWQQNKAIQYLIVGDEKERASIEQVLSHNDINYHISDVLVYDSRQNVCVTLEDRLEQFYDTSGKLKTVIFTFPQVSNTDAISAMETFKSKFRFEFIIEGSDTIIGSESKDRSGSTLNATGNFNLNKDNYQRQKLITDYVISICAIIISPVMIWKVDSISLYFKNILRILVRRRTWVSYDHEKSSYRELPTLPIGIVSAHVAYQDERQSSEDSNFIYARDYSPWIDFSVFVKNPKMMGKKINK